jgi:hypothetical protein
MTIVESGLKTKPMLFDGKSIGFLGEKHNFSGAKA